MRTAAIGFLRSRLCRNLLANYVGAAINALAPLLAIPILIRTLGQEQWGLVAFVNLMLAMMLMLNVGISQALVREFAHRWSGDAESRLRAATLLRGYETIYWGVAFVVAACFLPLSSQIADQWLNTSRGVEDLARISVVFAIALFVASLPASIYRGALLAVQEHTLLNAIRTIATLAKVAFGVLAVLQTPSIVAYLTVFVGISYLETMAMALASWRLMPCRRRETPNRWSEVRATLKFSITMSVLVVLGVATTQVDRFFVSALLPIEELGVYSIAVSIAFSALQISYPLFTSVMPTLVAIGGETRRRLTALRNLLLTVLAIVIVGGGMYATFGGVVLSYWLGDLDLAERVEQPLTWLLCGSALNMIYNVGYTNWVSMGNTAWIAWVNILALCPTLILLPLTISAWGLVGATMSYVIVNTIGATFALVWLATSHQRERGS